MSCEICGTTEGLRSMQTTRPVPVVLCRACAYVAGTDPRTVLALVDALVNDPVLAQLPQFEVRDPGFRATPRCRCAPWHTGARHGACSADQVH